MAGNLYLIPTPIAESSLENSVTPGVRAALKTIQFFLAEDIRTARRFLSSLKFYESIEALDFKVLNKDTSEKDLNELFSPLMRGKNLGILSEAGCPGVADPGSLAVRYAHQNGIKVIPLVGPSSILLALMASGLNGQHFAFHGYLPIDGAEVIQAIKTLEKESRSKNQTQIFIETPYRNNQMMNHLLKTLNPETQLCIAVDITGAGESIVSKQVKFWKDQKPEFPKLPAVFLFLA
ncbi:MAG: SAM-dependent methyltransferase [Cyclobacteriaceae bacterium]